MSYLQKSVSSRATALFSSDSNVPSRLASHSVSLFAQGGKRDASEEKGAIIHPSSLSFVKKADILPDAEILSHFNALLSLPYSDGRPSLDFTTVMKKRRKGQDDVSLEEKNDDNNEANKKKKEEEEEEEEEERRFLLSAVSRNSDMSSLPTPGVARAMLDLCSTSSARMLSTTSLLNTSSSSSAAADSHARSSNNTSSSSSSSSSGVEPSSSTLSSSSNRMLVLDMNVRVPTRVSSNNRRDQVRVSLPSRLGEREGVHAEGSSSSPPLDGDDAMMMTMASDNGGSPPPSRGGGGEDGGQFSQSIIASGPATTSNSTSKSSSSSSSVVLLRPSLRDKEAEKESNKSMALTFAAEADPEGVLDRRILKKLASTMNTIEEKRKTAERESATSAKGKIDLQQAMARRASLARLMTSIATNADQAFAGTFKSSSSSSSDLPSSSSSSTLDADSSMLLTGSTDARPGLSIYTQKPRLR